MPLNPTHTINGSFVKVYVNGKWYTNAKAIEFQAEVNYEDILRSGTRGVGKKATSVEYTGTISGYKVNHDLAKAIARITNDKRGALVTEIMAEVNDPEALGAKAFIRIKGVQFNTIPIINAEAGAIVEEEFPFTATGYTYL
ncbi:phage tail tube protein [Priestia megaterium]|uniref:phage tail tube protein n=1 Tax=Priestia megaterium TaxID=1404 RepID=UPI00345835F1